MKKLVLVAAALFLLSLAACSDSAAPVPSDGDAQTGIVMLDAGVWPENDYTAGLPVPPGFAVTTAAFRTFFESAGLVDTIRSIRLGITPDDPACMAQAAEDIQAAILRAPLPEAVAGAIREAVGRIAEYCEETRVID